MPGFWFLPLFIFNSLFSKKTFHITSGLLQTAFPDVVKTENFSSDSITQVRLNHFVSNITGAINSEGQAKKYRLPDSIYVLFDTAKVHYVFCTCNIGFIRKRSNLIKTHQAIEIADVLLGDNRRPLQSNSSITCFVFDLKQKNLLSFERDIWMDKEPTDINIIKLQLARLINHSFI